MKFEVLNISDPRWNEIVKSFENYGVHYLKEYCIAFKMAGEGEPILFYYESENNRGINVEMKRDISLHPAFNELLNKDEFFDLSTPYGYGGWLFENGSNHQEAYDAYMEWCLNNNVVSEFVRFNLFDRCEDYYGETIPRISNVVRNLEDSFENIEHNFERRVRKDLKKTDGLEIILDKDGKYMDDFLRIYYDTMDRNNAENEYYFSREFYDVLNSMKDNVMYFHVALEGKIISTELVIMDGKNMYSYLGGTDNNYFAYHPNHFIKYHIIKWGVENNFKNFVLGGGYGSNDGIFMFKKGFAPDGIVQFYTGQKIFNEELYNKLLNIRIKNGLNIEGNKYFPLYRAN